MTMTPERFNEIVQAYGADPRRWPAHERASAQSWAAAHGDAARARIAEASLLDDCLARDVVADPGRALQRRILADAGLPRPRRAFGHWWPGAALAGVGLAGGLAGALVCALMLASNATSGPQESSYMTTAFGTTIADGSAE